MKFIPGIEVASKITCLLVTVIGALGLSQTALASISGSDDFNDNFKDPAKWGADITNGNGVLAEANQRLDYTCTSPLIGDQDFSVRPWILNQATYNTDWEVFLDVHNSVTPSGINEALVGILAGKDLENYVYIELDGGRRQFNSGVLLGGNEVSGGDSLSNPAVTDAAVRVVFNSQSKVFTVFYDPDGGVGGYVWRLLASYGINGSGGTTGNTSWGLSGSQTFQVAIYGLSSNRAVTSGQMYADNFSGQTAPAVSPLVTNRVSGGSLVMSWPQSALNYSLQESSVLASNSWSSAAQSPVLSNGTYSVVIPLTGSGRFFRLKR